MFYPSPPELWSSQRKQGPSAPAGASAAGRRQPPPRRHGGVGGQPQPGAVPAAAGRTRRPLGGARRQAELGAGGLGSGSGVASWPRLSSRPRSLRFFFKQVLRILANAGEYLEAFIDGESQGIGRPGPCSLPLLQALWERSPLPLTAGESREGLSAALSPLLVSAACVKYRHQRFLTRCIQVMAPLKDKTLPVGGLEVSLDH